MPESTHGAWDSDSNEVLNEDTQHLDEQSDTLLVDLERAKAKEAALIIIRGTPQGKKFELAGNSITIGRERGNSIRINSASISRCHASLVREDDGFVIEDLGSRNGTFVNGVPVESPRRLKKEDRIKVGTTLLKYIPAGEIEILYLENLANAAYVDDLTELYNRNYISQFFTAEFKQAKALHSSFALALIDVDDFKQINDTHGHDAGDCVLRELAGVVQASFDGDGDAMGRLGGDELLVILTRSGPEEAMEAAERAREAVESFEFLYEETVIPVTISVGVAVRKETHGLTTDLYKDVDQALYAAKHAGKNQTSLSS